MSDKHTIEELRQKTTGKLQSYVMAIMQYYPELRYIEDFEGVSIGSLLKIPNFGRKSFASLAIYVAEHYSVNIGGHTLTKKLMVDGFKSNKELRDEIAELRRQSPTKTLRDEIAIAAMQGMMTQSINPNLVAVEVLAYEMADRMLEQRSKTNRA